MLLDYPGQHHRNPLCDRLTICYRRPLLPEAGFLLEGVSQLQHPQVSSRCRLTIRTPTGRRSGVKLQGTEMADRPVAVM
jgi:hypothetical protein